MNGERGPLYCETFLNTTNIFPIEPINVLTSLVPVVAGLLAFWWLRRQGSTDKVAYTLAVLAALTGLGSVLWHGLRTNLALTLDVLPGLLYFLTLLFFWPCRLKNRWWSYGVIMGLFTSVFALAYILPDASRNGPPLSLFVSVAIFASGLLYLTYHKNRQAFLWGAVMIVAALIAATSRTVDLSTCEIVPVGTHFLWHIFLGIAAYCGVRLLSELSPRPTEGEKGSDTFKLK